MCFVYTDFRQLAQDQSTTAARTVEVLRAMDNRLLILEQHTLLPQPTATPSSL